MTDAIAIAIISGFTTIVAAWISRKKQYPMTLSNSDRRAAVDTALGRMLEDLGDHSVDAVRFEIGSDRYRDLPQTTWLELESEMLVKQMHAVGSPAYRLTGAGWIAALKAAGQCEDSTLREQAITLRTALKDKVKGRPLQGALTDFYGLQAATGLSIDWLYNALANRLLEHLWPTDHLEVQLEHGGRSIRVPARFGSARLPE